MFNVVFQRVLQAWQLYGALGAISTSYLDPNAVTREKHLGR
jgi:hypothetical protein